MGEKKKGERRRVHAYVTNVPTAPTWGGACQRLSQKLFFEWLWHWDGFDVWMEHGFSTSMHNEDVQWRKTERDTERGGGVDGEQPWVHLISHIKDTHSAMLLRGPRQSAQSVASLPLSMSDSYRDPVHSSSLRPIIPLYTQCMTLLYFWSCSHAQHNMVSFVHPLCCPLDVHTCTHRGVTDTHMCRGGQYMN